MNNKLISKIYKLKTNSRGFTLMEIMVSVSLFVVIMLLTGSIFSLAQKSYNKSSDLAELTQNSRVCIDRLSRELRQSIYVITELQSTEEESTSEIFFQDGHDISQITYLRYYLYNNELIREHKAYFFADSPLIYVAHNSVDQDNNPPQEIILENYTVGEYFNQLKFWGSNGLINISLKLIKNSNVFAIKTSVFTRN
ncbi:MAG: prepilin-type N-terminal cleavage/methylation domain-containing protein [bacterium]|nr:prepilin-type N-terminal cleavage/methylation domain-containing protein [bacterium]